MLFLFYSHDLVKEMDKQAKNGTLINKVGIHQNIHCRHNHPFSENTPENSPAPSSPPSPASLLEGHPHAFPFLSDGFGLV